MTSAAPLVRVQVASVVIDLDHSAVVLLADESPGGEGVGAEAGHD